MYSDVSLDDVHDLSQKLEIIQRQITNLTDTHMSTEDRTTRAKTEYAVLQTKYDILEEQLRDAELRSEERIGEEQKRYKELLARVEREAQLTNENCQIRIQTMESETITLRDEIQRLRNQSDKQRHDLESNEEKLELMREKLDLVHQNLAEARAHEKQFEVEKSQSDNIIAELSREIERIRTETQAIMVSVNKTNGFYNPTFSASSVSLGSNVSTDQYSVDEILSELEELKLKNRQLNETNEELQAMLLNKNIEEGRNLLNGGNAISNLADELKEMDRNQVISLKDFNFSNKNTTIPLRMNLMRHS
jgi:Rab11 family-interacting protein 3/4